MTYSVDPRTGKLFKIGSLSLRVVPEELSRNSVVPRHHDVEQTWSAFLFSSDVFNFNIRHRDGEIA